MENDIVVDEMMHGVTNCMMGSGTGRCLQMTEAGGLGEGWSDTMAKYVSLSVCVVLLRMKYLHIYVARWVVQNSAKVEDFVMGQYILGMAQGIRTYPYSTNAYVLFPISAPPTSLTGTICRTTNPLCYSNLTTLNEVHAIGEVWANMLHNVYTALVDAHGFLTTALMDLTGEQGNVVFMHLMISALLLQPCNPTCMYTSLFTHTHTPNTGTLSILVLTFFCFVFFFQLFLHVMLGSRLTSISTNMTRSTPKLHCLLSAPPHNHRRTKSNPSKLDSNTMRRMVHY